MVMFVSQVLILHYYFVFIAVIEKYTENVRFCIICNYLGKIIPAIQSRCTRFRFAPLQSSQIVPRVQDIIAKEKYVYYHDPYRFIYYVSLRMFFCTVLA